ncbi:MAG: sensor histidine kinase [Candidatus Ventricola sp.]
MQHFRQLLPRTLSFRFLLIFFFAAIVPFLTISTITLSRVSDAMEEEAQERTTQMIHLAASNLDAHMDTLSSITEKMYVYSTGEYGVTKTLEDILKSSGSSTTAIMKNYVSTLLDNNDSLYNVMFIDLVNDQVYTAGRPGTKTLRNGLHYTELDFYEEAISHPRRLTVSEPHKEDYFFRSNETVISLCRPLLALSALPTREIVLGVMVLDIHYSLFEDAFSAYDWAQSGELFVTNAEDTIIYAPDASMIGQKHVLPAQPGISTLTEDMPSVGFTICYHLNRDLLMRDVRRLRDSLIVLMLVALCVMVLATVLSSQHISRPVKQILKQMKRVQEGDLYARVSVHGNDELSDLSRGFNQMVSDLDTHIQRSYLASIKQKEAELDALKMQIHPHFLYNTLEVIRMSAVDHQDTATADMTMALVHQLQYVIGERHEYVLLSTELQMVSEYIDLVKVRYGQIVLKVNFPSRYAQCEILKMTLQPIVENAVQHGLRPLGGGQLSIDVQGCAGSLIITVMDNGCGMDEEQLSKLRSRLNSPELPEPGEDGLRSIGTKNVHDRIRLACGEPFGLEIESQTGVGTAVVMRLPYRTREVNHEATDC